MVGRPTPQSTRREGIPSQSFRLADCELWGFARPTIRLSPKVVKSLDVMGRPRERICVELGFGYPYEIERLIENVRVSHEHGSTKEQYDAFFELAVRLLRRCHDLSQEFACEVLTVSEEELPLLVEVVMSLVSESERTTLDETGQGAEE